MRLFLALDLPSFVVDKLAAISDQVKQSVPAQAIRWVKPESIHLTLKFLGEVKPEFVDQVDEMVGPIAAATPRMSLVIGKLGGFPNLNRPRVLWVGVEEGTGALEQLRNSLEASFEPFGFERERRSFRPHLTIGRVKRGAGRRERQAIADGMAEHSIGTIATMEASELTLFESVLGPGGATYRPLREFDFLKGLE